MRLKQGWMVPLAFWFVAGVAASDLHKLETAVGQYWELLKKGERQRASEFVAPDGQQNFLNRQEPPFLSWKIVALEPSDRPQVQVTVLIERVIQGGVFDWKVVENWEWQNGNWRVRIEDPVAPRRMLFQGSERKPSPGLLKVAPEELRIHLLDRSQKDSLVVFNGLDRPVEVLGFEFDRERFECVEQPSTLEPGAVGRLTLLYRGTDQGKNLKSQAVLVLKHGPEESRFSVPVTYNFVSPGARGLFGLTSEAVEQLDKDSPLTPKIIAPHR